MKKTSIIGLLISLLFFSCSSDNGFEISDFNALSNFSFENDTLTLPMDLSDAIMHGIKIPAEGQYNDGYFRFSFKITNSSKIARSYYYKIFYQNESYKFSEYVKKEYNTLAGNNFYGSWENAADTFHKTIPIPADNKYHLITDSFRIVGNPRNESKYKGAKTKFIEISDEMVSQTIAGIVNTPEWYKSIQEKAINNKVPLDEQLYLDAYWVINNNSQKGEENNRWKRNPRVGAYSFILLVFPEDNINLIPDHLKNIAVSENGSFINPYFTLLYDSKFLKQNKKNIIVAKSKNTLKTFASLDPGTGIYIDLFKYNKFDIDKSYFTENCGNTEELFGKAHFEQLFHYIDKNFSLKNLPVVYDVVSDNYNQDDYKKNKLKFNDDKLIRDFVKTTDCPCKTVKYDTAINALTIHNPGNDVNTFRKENVGVNSRIGFTYGKFIAKIKFPSIINQDNVWNGITSAFWLLYQDGNEWNNRSICENTGYIPKSEVGETNVRVKTTSYSEIDFEILKTSRFWPKTSYKDSLNVPYDSPELNSDIIITCTNWDMACRSPEKFSIGATDFYHNNNKYVVHRWDDWNHTLTIKHPINHDSIFNQPYYFEIDWKPESLTWRIGKERNQMREIAYMDNTITTIPDNQMIVVVSQEFHDAKWWPLSPFIQDLIPFPKNDIKGEILELQIE
ncbi:MAG: hypothetical protein R6W78_03490 [Bacteroidales bacterium]